MKVSNLFLVFLSKNKPFKAQIDLQTPKMIDPKTIRQRLSAGLRGSSISESVIDYIETNDLDSNIIKKTPRFFRHIINNKKHITCLLIMFFLVGYIWNTYCITIVSMIGDMNWSIHKLFGYHHEYLKINDQKQQLLPYSNHTNNNWDGIPKIVHFVWVGSNTTMMVPRMHKTIQIWHEQYKNTGFEFILWDNNKSETLLHSKYPEFIDIYYKVSPVKRSDLIRYMFMYEFGGIYIDLDIQPRSTKSLDTILYGLDALFVETPNIGITNMMFASKAKNPFFKFLLKRIYNRYYKSQSFNSLLPKTLSTTTIFGTAQFWDSYENFDWNSNDKIKILRTENLGKCFLCSKVKCPNYQDDNSFFIHIEGDSWKDNNIVELMFLCYSGLTFFAVYSIANFMVKKARNNKKFDNTQCLVIHIFTAFCLFSVRWLYFMFKRPICV